MGWPPPDLEHRLSNCSSRITSGPQGVKGTHTEMFLFYNLFEILRLNYRISKEVSSTLT